MCVCVCVCVFVSRKTANPGPSLRASYVLGMLVRVQHERVSQVPMQLERNLKLPTPTPKNNEILPSTRVKALLHCSISQEIPHCLLELEKELDTLHETPEASRDTRPHLRGTLSFQPQLKKSPVFHSSTRYECQFLCFGSQGIPMLPSPLKRRPVSP